MGVEHDEYRTVIFKQSVETNRIPPSGQRILWAKARKGEAVRGKMLYMVYNYYSTCILYTCSLLSPDTRLEGREAVVWEGAANV